MFYLAHKTLVYILKLPIVEYIEETRTTGMSLLPKDPIQRAKARQIAEIINSGMQPYQNLNVIKKIAEYGGEEKKLAWLNFHLKKGLASLEAVLKETSGTYCVGNNTCLSNRLKFIN